jgi:uncharacterized membrane protein YedE/YeeE
MIDALIGGMIIGLAVSIMLVFNGRVTGISGIIQAAVFEKQDRSWRLAFLAGLVFGGVVLHTLRPDFFVSNLSLQSWQIPVAGFLVGFGTLLGSGCTSGHGVCGISRLSVRSIVATISFITSGVLTLVILRFLGVVS